MLLMFCWHFYPFVSTHAKFSPVPVLHIKSRLCRVCYIWWVEWNCKKHLSGWGGFVYRGITCVTEALLVLPDLILTSELLITVRCQRRRRWRGLWKTVKCPEWLIFIEVCAIMPLVLLLAMTPAAFIPSPIAACTRRSWFLEFCKGSEKKRRPNIARCFMIMVLWYICTDERAYLLWWMTVSFDIADAQ